MTLEDKYTRDTGNSPYVKVSIQDEAEKQSFYSDDFVKWLKDMIKESPNLESAKNWAKRELDKMGNKKN